MTDKQLEDEYPNDVRFWYLTLVYRPLWQLRAISDISCPLTLNNPIAAY